MKKLYAILTLLVALSLALTACGPKQTPTPVATEPPMTEAPMTEAPMTEAPAVFKVGQVTDLGGIDDKSFNASASDFRLETALHRVIDELRRMAERGKVTKIQIRRRSAKMESQ